MSRSYPTPASASVSTTAGISSGAAARALERAGYHVLPDERTLAVGVGPREIPDDVETLANAGVEYERLTWRQPSLKDAYLATTGTDPTGEVSR